MEVSGEGMTLDLKDGLRAQLMAFNFVVVADKHPQGRSWLSGEAKVADQVSLHEVVRAPAVDEDHDRLVGEAAQQAVGFQDRMT